MLREGTPAARGEGTVPFHFNPGHFSQLAQVELWGRWLPRWGLLVLPHRPLLAVGMT